MSLTQVPENAPQHLASLNAITIKNISGAEIELKYVFQEIELYENVFTKFLEGTVLITTASDPLRYVPIFGGEILRISFNTQEDADRVFDREFIVIGAGQELKNSNVTVQNNNMLRLSFISKEGFNNLKSRVSKKYSGDINSIIQDVMTDLKTVRKCTTISSTDTIDVHSNYWHPADAITYALKHTKTAKYYDYVFYESLDGFRLKSLTELMSYDGAVRKLNVSPAGSKLHQTDIQQSKMSSHFDLPSAIKSGAYGKTTYKYDVTGNTFSKLAHTYNEMTDKYTVLGKKSTVSPKFETDNLTIDLANYDHEISHYRNTLLGILTDYTMMVNVGGSSSRRAGSLVELSEIAEDGQRKIHPQKSGKWLILSIGHIITNDLKYIQTLTIVKNGFFDGRYLNEPIGGTNL